MRKSAIRKGTYRYLLLCLSLLCLSCLCAAGCGKRSVEYIGDGEDSTDAPELSETGQGEGLWEESFAATRENGDTVTVKVKTAVRSGPDTSQVIGIKRAALDGNTGEQIVKAALGDEAGLEDGVYTGSRNGMPYKMRIGQNRISFYPKDMKEIAPEDIKDAIDVSLYAGGGTTGGGNMTELPEEEAEELAGQFLEEIGFTDRELIEAKTLEWTGQMELLGEDWWSTMSLQNGYVFYYAQTVGGEILPQILSDTDTDGFWLWQDGEEESWDIYEAKMHTVVCVYGHEVIAADIYNIYEVTSMEDDVTLLPVKTVQGIMQKEVAQPDEYYADLNNNSLYYWGMNYGYCLLWDDEFTQGSYVPIWELRGNMDFMSIMVNAIDGSIITWEQKEGLKSVNPTAEE